jgi:capsule polysaccharide export protein KpsE/RkpR
MANLGKNDLLAELEKEAEQVTTKKGQVEENEAQWRNDRRDCLAIPSKSALDRSNRYETSNVRHRYKVEARLAELQARPRRNAQLHSVRLSDEEKQPEKTLCETKPSGFSGEPQVGELRARVAKLEEQVAQEESLPRSCRLGSCPGRR